MGAAVFAWGTMAVLHHGLMISRQFVNILFLIFRVMVRSALTIRLPSAAALSHLVVYNVMEQQLFDLRALLGCGNCTIH